MPENNCRAGTTRTFMASPKQLKKGSDINNRSNCCTHLSLEALISEVSEQQKLSRKGSFAGSSSGPQCKPGKSLYGNGCIQDHET